MASIRRRETKGGERRYDVRWKLGHRTVARTFKLKKDADTFRRQVEHDELRGIRLDPAGGRITFSDWWDLYWPSAMHLRATTRARDESLYRNRIKPSFGDLTLDRIDRPTLRRWVTELSDAGLAPTTVAKCSQIVRKVLAAAVDDGNLGYNPADRLDLPRVEREETRFLGPEEIALLAESIDPRYRALVFLGGYGGLRIGEMLALRVRHVDTIKGRVEVLVTLSDVKGKLITNPPKTNAGRRTVPIPRLVADELAAHIDGKAKADYVFTGPGGGPVWPRAFRSRVWVPAITTAKLEGLRVHDLRHSAVALWIAASASPKEIAVRAGHTSVVTVLDRYGHLLPTTATDVTDRLEEMARSARPGP